MNDLPIGWVKIQLKEVVDVLDNERIPINSDERSKRIGNIPYYGATGQVGWIDDFIFNEELLLIGEDGAPFFEKNKNIAYIINGKSWVNNHAHVLRALKIITSNSFLKHYLNQFDFTEYVNGTTRLKLTQGSMRNIPVLIPPLNEQKRIVEKLDKLLAKVEDAKSRLEKIPVILKRFRQSVLNSAVTGELTKDWRTQNGIVEDWRQINLRDYSVKIGSGSTPRGGQSVYKKSGIPLIRSMNVYSGGFSDDGLVFIDKEQAYYLRNVTVKNNDVLLNITGASIGRVCLAPSNMEGARVNQHVCIIRTSGEIQHPFLQIYLSSTIMQDYINTENYGVTRQALTKFMIENFIIPFPTEEEQQEIVKRVKALFKKADEIEERYKKAKAYVDKLTQSILAKAFRGELVPQDPNDEPASKLLERIKEEKTAIVKKKKK